MKKPYPNEDRFVAELRKRLARRGSVPVGIGDDAAVLKGGVVVTTDGYADSVHFDRRYLSMSEIGGRCACAALSDIVAMGACPDALFVTLVMPEGITSRQIAALYRGIDAVCGRLDCEVAGGDTLLGPALILALTATGRTRRPLLRSTARPGQGLYVTGHVGAAESGRLMLMSDHHASRLDQAVSRHVLPIPRLPAMLALRRRITALIDMSDGLASDARRIAAASCARVVIEIDPLPVLDTTRRLCLARGLDTGEFALQAGEDYELLFTSDSLVPPRVDGLPVTRVGRVERGSGLWLERNGQMRRCRLRGYDHFSVRGRSC